MLVLAYIAVFLETVWGNAFELSNRTNYIQKLSLKTNEWFNYKMLCYLIQHNIYYLLNRTLLKFTFHSNSLVKLSKLHEILFVHTEFHKYNTL